VRTLSIEAPAHGRVLVRDVDSPRGLLVGFHGYAETAETQLERLAAVPGTDAWTLVAAQGLNRFYRGRTQDVVAGWMTRQDRDDAIRDNVAYVDNVIEATRNGSEPIVVAGFSQGVAMAFRAAVLGRAGVNGVIAVGGDIPPELLAGSASASPFPRVLLIRGATDDWYTAKKLDADMSALRARGEEPEAFTHDGGHEWTADVAMAAGDFLAHWNGLRTR
jgi:predicted esterase